VRVDLFAVLLLQAKNHLHRRKGAGTIIDRSDQLLVRGDRELGGVFELYKDQQGSANITFLATNNVSLCQLAVNVFLHHTILVNPLVSFSIHTIAILNLSIVSTFPYF